MNDFIKLHDRTESGGHSQQATTSDAQVPETTSSSEVQGTTSGQGQPR